MTPTIFSKIKAMTYKKYGDGRYYKKENLEGDIAQETPQVTRFKNLLIQAGIIIFDDRNRCGWFRVKSDQRQLEV